MKTETVPFATGSHLRNFNRGTFNRLPNRQLTDHTEFVRIESHSPSYG